MIGRSHISRAVLDNNIMTRPIIGPRTLPKVCLPYSDIAYRTSGGNNTIKARSGTSSDFTNGWAWPEARATPLPSADKCYFRANIRLIKFANIGPKYLSGQVQFGVLLVAFLFSNRYSTEATAQQVLGFAPRSSK
jgi:hypothetical protein